MNNSHSTFSRAGRSTLAVAAAAAVFTSCFTIGSPEAHASASTPFEYLTAAIGAIRELDEADKDLDLAEKTGKTEDWVAARQHVSNYYYNFYDPQLEGPSRGLSPVDGRPRKPMMEGYKADAVRAIRLCVAHKPSCDNEQNRKDVNRLRINVARDALILSGDISDDNPEASKLDAAKLFVDAIQHTDGEIKDPVAFAKKALVGDSKITKGKVITDADGWMAVLKNPQSWSSEIKSYAGSSGDDSDEQNSTGIVVPVAIATALVGALAFFAVNNPALSKFLPGLPSAAH